MGPSTFIAGLFIMAGACLMVAIGERSIAWLIGGVVFFGVGMYACKLINNEQVEGGFRLSFFGIAILVMLCCMFFLFLLQSFA